MRYRRTQTAIERLEKAEDGLKKQNNPSPSED